ncbi:hypothetical protein [Actibacterium sp. XHP0104]|uniref:hypothetical protein n=1 Tax=Actibacterium sp. XHP0104 TaxID=2984335 RepID=UPI0021E98D01|nr:hypothetical protein [Actibacterium sp. XHP0104]MCV2882857.1 hypothetical protein [Actibacterium sp. XHP0104]
MSWFDTPIILGFSAAQAWVFVAPLLAGFVAAIITHWLGIKRDKRNHRIQLEFEEKVAARQVRRDVLLGAYRKLDASEPQRLNHRNVSFDEAKHLLRQRAEAFADLNLFGNEELASQLEKLLEQSSNSYDTSIVMNSLRDALRKEFGLELTATRYKWLEIDPINPTKQETAK